MKLDVDFTELELAAAKMRGLDPYLLALRKAKKSFSEGLGLASQYAVDNGGEVSAVSNEGVTTIKALGEEAHCFQPYPDIDIFYFET
jgi:hypothetical protein